MKRTRADNGRFQKDEPLMKTSTIILILKIVILAFIMLPFLDALIRRKNFHMKIFDIYDGLFGCPKCECNQTAPVVTSKKTNTINGEEPKAGAME